MVPDNSGGRGSGSADEGGAGGLFPRVSQQVIAVGAGSLVPLGNAGSQGPWPASGTFLPKAAGAGASFLHLLSVTGCGLPPAPAVTLGCEEGGRDPGEVCWIEGPQAASFPRARTEIASFSALWPLLSMAPAHAGPSAARDGIHQRTQTRHAFLDAPSLSVLLFPSEHLARAYKSFICGFCQFPISPHKCARLGAEGLSFPTISLAGRGIEHGPHHGHVLKDM